jgi:flagellar assembly protein FliH
MSSKVLAEEDSRKATPIPWRRVQDMHAAASEPPVAADPVNQSAEMERLAEQRAQEAHAAGFREGEAAGRSRAAAEVQPVIERLTQSIDELARLRPKLRREAEGDVVRLALAVARRVLRRELASDPDAVQGIVLAALEKLQGQEISRARVHPAHAPLVAECLRKMAGGGASVEVVADASREPGAVIFETQRGNLDASIDSQLQEIERGLTDRLGKHA